MTNQAKEKNLDYLYKRRDSLDKIRIKMADSFDKYLLTFATGMLSLSITFTNTLIEEVKSRELLAFGWLSLVLAILFALFSIFLSIFAHERQVIITDEEIGEVIGDKTVTARANWFNEPITILQALATISFVSGIGILTNFYFQNLK